MEGMFKYFFNAELFAEPYDDYADYISDLVKQVEIMILCYISFTKKPNEVLDGFESIKIDKEQIKEILNHEENDDIRQKKERLREDFDKATFYIHQRAKSSISEGKNFAIDYISKIYNLSDLERFALILSLSPIIDSKYYKVFSYLQEDKNERILSYETALKIYFLTKDASDIDNYYEIKEDLSYKMNTYCFNNNSLCVDDRLASFILSNALYNLSQRGIESYIPMNADELPVQEEIAQKISDVMKECESMQEGVFLHLSGCETIGKRTQVKRVAQITNMPAIIVDLSQISRGDNFDFYNSITTAGRETCIKEGFLCICNFDELLRDEEEGEKYIRLLLDLSQRYSKFTFILSNQEIKNRSVIRDRLWLEIPMPSLTKDESIHLWDLLLKEINPDEDVKSFEMANKFSFTPGQIRGTIEECKKLAIWDQKEKITVKDICKCAYTQIVHNLEEKATLIYTKHNWSQLVLAKEQKEMLKNACDQIRYKHIVYDDWGFNKRINYGKGVSMLFAGPPGTGKTMAAQVVAEDLDIEIYKVDLSKIVSKYIGETEKNLDKLFSEAKKSNVILFFDETDALLGKRTEVKDSHDKNANLETSYLLQKMEEYDGITIMSTNYLENIDQAFFRRLSYVVHFPFPDVEARKEIWIKMFPQSTPLSDDIDFDYLASQFEISGGNIKNIAVTAAFLAAKQSGEIKMKHILKAVKYELTKQGKILLKEDFGEHSYMV